MRHQYRLGTGQAMPPKKMGLAMLYVSLFISCTQATDKRALTVKTDKMSEAKAGELAWSRLNNTTWSCKEGFAGTNYVFYADDHGVKKCLLQNLGSGVYVTSSRWLALEMVDKTSFKIENEAFNIVGDSVLSSPSKSMVLLKREAVVYNRTTQVAITIVKKIDDEVTLNNLLRKL